MGATLINPLMLCGSMFGLKIYRHRLFEIYPEPIYFPPAPCRHFRNPVVVAGHDFIAEQGRQAMGIDWMSRDELSQAIPWVYTEFIGKKLIAYLENNATP